MTGRSSVLVTAVAVLLLEAVPGLCRTAAQGPAAPPAAPAAETAQADEPAVAVRVTAVVRDARGRPVLDLAPSDFSLEDNGQPQTLTSVELRAVPRGTAGAALPPVDSAESEAAAAREPATRVFALFLDEFSVAAGEHSARVRDAARQFVDGQLRPADLLCVLKPLGTVSSLRCSRDREAARTVIAGFEGRRGDYEARSDFERQYFGRTPAAVEGARAQIVTNVLRELTLHVGELRSTRAALVLVTEGLVRTPGDRRRLPGWQALARAASHFNLPIYTLDPSTPDPSPAAAPEPSTTRPAGEDRGMTAEALAAQTGGEAFAGPDLTSAFERIGRDLDAYYVLTYTPSAPTDGRFHPIVVRAARPATVVRAPTGYWSPLSREWRTWLNRPSTPAFTMPTRALRRSPLIDMWYGFERTPDGVMRMVVTWQPASLVARPRAPQPALVALKAGTAETPSAVEVELRAASAAGEDDGGASRAVFPVSPGRVQLDLQVTAMDGTVLDTAAQDVEVPALRGTAPLILQPQIIRARTRRDVARLAEAAEVSPSPSRVFRRTERLLIRVPAYALDDSPLAVTAALVNTRGQKIRDIELLPRDGATGAAQFDLPLAFLPPGDYGLEFTASGAAGTSRQLLRFEITG